MTIEEYKKLPYTRVIRPVSDESGDYYTAYVLELDGCMSVGDSFEGACENLNEAMELWLELAIEKGDKIPMPVADETYSGKFVVRIPKSLHKKLAIEAKLEGLSLNQYALYKLAR